MIIDCQVHWYPTSSSSKSFALGSGTHERSEPKGVSATSSPREQVAFHYHPIMLTLISRCRSCAESGVDIVVVSPSWVGGRYSTRTIRSAPVPCAVLK